MTNNGKSHMIAKIINGNTIRVVDKTQFTDATLKCGQVFRYTDLGNGRYKILTGDNWAEIDFGSGMVKCNDAEYFFNYFDFGTDYNGFINELQKFEKLPIVNGIRILKQDFFECVISFIVSANNNIKRFTKTLFSLFDGRVIEDMTEADFSRIGCGYRSVYLVKTIKQLRNYDYSELTELDNDSLRKRLMMLSGVGRKVADCIMLFAFHRLDAAPVDTHIGKAIEQLGKQQANKVFGNKYAGIAQQYIFYYLQHLKKELK